MLRAQGLPRSRGGVLAIYGNLELGKLGPPLKMSSREAVLLCSNVCVPNNVRKDLQIPTFEIATPQDFMKFANSYTRTVKTLST